MSKNQNYLTIDEKEKHKKQETFIYHDYHWCFPGQLSMRNKLQKRVKV